MAYHIAVDSCTDMTAAMKKDEHITLVPLTLNVGEVLKSQYKHISVVRGGAVAIEAMSTGCR